MKKTNVILTSLAIGFAALGASAEDAYVESLGTSFMNTGYCVTPQSKVEIDFAYTDTETRQQCIFGSARDNAKVMSLTLGCDGSLNMRYYYGKTQITPGVGKKIDNERHTAVVDFPSQKLLYITGATTNSTITIDDEMMATNVTTATMPLGLFSAIDDTDGTTDKNWTRAKAKIYGCKIWETGTLVRDYVPCRENGVVGFRETVSGAFICGADSSAFTGGGDIADYEPAYIQSAGTSFMNTRHLVSPKTKIEVEFAFTDASTDQQRIFGASSAAAGDSNRTGLYLNKDNQVSFLYGDNGKYVGTDLAADTLHHTTVLDLSGKKAQYLYGGVQKYGTTLTDAITATATWPLALFSDMKGATGVNDYASWTRTTARIYRCRIWEDGALVHDYKPCVKGGLAGFRDLVDGYFICGEDASAFTAGGDVEQIMDDAYVSTPYNCNTEGLCSIDTGYKVGPNTAVCIDYALLRNGGDQGGGAFYLFDATRYSSGGNERFNIYSHASGGLRYCNGATKWQSTSIPTSTAKNVRRQATADSYNKTVVISTGSYTNQAIEVSSAISDTFGYTLKLCSTHNNAAESAAMKVYGLKIYESGKLVYDYVPYVKDGVPGLYDKAKGSFITAMASSGISGDAAIHKQLMAGGNIEGLVQDAYLESDGTGIIKTDYYANSKTKIVADYMLLTTNFYSRVAGYEDSGSTVQWWIQAGTGSNNYTLRPMLGTVAGSPSDKIDFYRHVSTMDSPNKTYSHTGAGWNWTTTKGGEISGTCDGPLGVFGYGTSSDWSTYGGLCKMRLYSLKIYESGELVRQYLPYQSGTTVGLKDTMTGNVLTDFNGSATAFMIAGGGSDGETFAIKPADKAAPRGATKTLTAFAPGATKYIWTVDGEVQATTTDELAVTVPEKGAKILGVTCTPVFTIDNTEVKGTAATATITVQCGLIITIY